MTHHPEWSRHQIDRALYLSSVGTAVERIAEDCGTPLNVTVGRLHELRRRPPAPQPGMADAIDEYIAFLGIA